MRLMISVKSACRGSDLEPHLHTLSTPASSRSKQAHTMLAHNEHGYGNLFRYLEYVTYTAEMIGRTGTIGRMNNLE